MAKIIWVNHQPSGGKEWVAKMVGRDPKYKFRREFLPAIERNWSSSGKTGGTAFEIKEGYIYEVNEPWNGRYFVKVENGEIAKVSLDDALRFVDEIERNRKEVA